MINPIYIFDLDGTLSLNEHRQHFVQGKDQNWDAFFEACDFDEPNLPVIETLKSLHKSGAEIWIWSGRSDSVSDKTLTWLHDNGILKLVKDIKFRADGDFTPDDKLKCSWLCGVEPDVYKRIVCVFDDRDKVVKMWRECGMPCFQVAQGSF